MDETQMNTPEKDEQAEVTVPVKFNKETVNLTLSEAATLAQKGMKLDKIAPDVERLKNLAKSKNLSVNDYLLSLENAKEAQDVHNAAVISSTGPQSARQSADVDPAGAEFLKGLWGK